MLSSEQGSSKRDQGDSGDELSLGNDQVELCLVLGLELGQWQRDVERSAAAKDADAVITRRVGREPPPRDGHWGRDRLNAIPVLCESLPPQQILAEPSCEMSPVARAAQTIQRVQNLTHECAPSWHHRAHEDHLPRQSLKLLALDGFASFDVAQLVQNLLNAKRVDADGHVHRVDDKAENLHHLGGQKCLGLGHGHTEVCTHLEPELHLCQRILIGVTSSEEVIDVGLENAQ